MPNEPTSHPADESRNEPISEQPTRIKIGLKRLRRFGVCELIAYVALAIAATWPLAKDIDGQIPLGVEPVPTVHLLQAWTTLWNADRLAHGLSDYWDAPMFHPTKRVFAFSEPQPTLMLVAPLVWISDSPALAYNVYVLMGFALNGFAAFHLLRRLGLGWSVAFFGGAIVESLPMMHWRLGLVQLTGLYGTIWTIHALYNFGSVPSVKRGLIVGLAFAITYYVCNYFGLFLATTLLMSVWWLFGRSAANWRTYGKLVPGGCLSLALIAPIVFMQLKVSKENNWKPRPEPTLMVLSSDVADFGHTPWPQKYGLPDFTGQENNPSFRRLSPGIIKYGLAILGLLWCLFQFDGPYRRWAMFCATVMAFAFLMSMGLKFQIGDTQPARWAMAYLPGHSHTRSIFRYAYLVQVCVGLMSAFGLHAIYLLSRRAKLKVLPTLAVAVVGFIAVTEVWPAPQNTYALPRAADRPQWVHWLATHTREGTPVACIPFSSGKTVFHYVRTMQWVYWTSFHHRPILNGYSSQSTPAYRELRDSMSAFPDAKTLKMMYGMGARYCVIQRHIGTRESFEANPVCKDVLIHQFADEAANADIYRLLAPPAQPNE